MPRKQLLQLSLPTGIGCVGVPGNTVSPNSFDPDTQVCFLGVLHLRSVFSGDIASHLTQNHLDQPGTKPQPGHPSTSHGHRVGPLVLTGDSGTSCWGRDASGSDSSCWPLAPRTNSLLSFVSVLGGKTVSDCFSLSKSLPQGALGRKDELPMIDEVGSVRPFICLLNER